MGSVDTSYLKEETNTGSVQMQERNFAESYDDGAHVERMAMRLQEQDDAHALLEGIVAHVNSSASVADRKKVPSAGTDFLINDQALGEEYAKETHQDVRATGWPQALKK